MEMFVSDNSMGFSSIHTYWALTLSIAASFRLSINTIRAQLVVDLFTLGQVSKSMKIFFLFVAVLIEIIL